MFALLARPQNAELDRLIEEEPELELLIAARHAAKVAYGLMMTHSGANAGQECGCRECMERQWFWWCCEMLENSLGSLLRGYVPFVRWEEAQEKAESAQQADDGDGDGDGGDDDPPDIAALMAELPPGVRPEPGKMPSAMLWKMLREARMLHPENGHAAANGEPVPDLEADALNIVGPGTRPGL